MIETFYTFNDLAAMALEELGVQDAGQPVEAEDVKRLEDRWISVQSDLNNRDIGYFDPTSIEGWALLPLAKVLAYNAINAFSVTDSTKIALLTAQGGRDGEAERSLVDGRRLRSPRQTMRLEQFNRPWWRRRGGAW